MSPHLTKNQENFLRVSLIVFTYLNLMSQRVLTWNQFFAKLDYEIMLAKVISLPRDLKKILHFCELYNFSKPS